MKLTLETMAPETFYVPDGAGQVKQPDEGRHDPPDGRARRCRERHRLPDATVTVRITGAAGTAFDGPLYPMIGRGDGLHYGENIALSTPGDYTVQLVASPPKVGRHTDVEQAWSSTIRTSFAFSWDGKMAMAR